MSKTARLLLNGAGDINPVSVEEYIKIGGFKSIEKVVNMSDQDILDQVLESNLLGRGGAAYPTGRKWAQLYKIEGDPKYIVCNCDEGEPGTFKDRDLIKDVPLRVIEGMLIAGYLFKSPKGYIYIRGEYRKYARIFQEALDNAKKAGYLGENIMGIKDFNYDIVIVSGAGAYICGENSAMLNSIEGKTGRPRIKPPHLAEIGLYSKPTLVNNVESFASIPVIFDIGATVFRENGDTNDGGTKLICLSGHTKNRGIYEMYIGESLRNIIYDEELGGGIKDDKELKFFHLGGQSGPLGFPEQLDTRFCYDDLKGAGLAMGTGAVVVLDESVCIVDYVKHVMGFFVHESCGKCTPCRIGTKKIFDLLEKFTKGQAKSEDLGRLEYLIQHVTSLSQCGLGQAASKSIMSALKHRREEFLAHIDGNCPSSSCNMNGEVE